MTKKELIEKLEAYSDDTEIFLEYTQECDGEVCTNYTETCNVYWVDDTFQGKIKGVVIV